MDKKSKYSNGEILKVQKSTAFSLLLIYQPFFQIYRRKKSFKIFKRNSLNLFKSLDCDVNKIEGNSKDWIRLFCSVYQTKDVTPYMHALAMHVPEFLHLYGNIVMFSQQGHEKLNDVTTIHFQHSTNHRKAETLKQLLEKETE